MRTFAGILAVTLLCGAPAMAETLTNGTGDGKVSVTVGRSGNFGTNSGGGGSALYDPVGATPQGSSTYYSDVYFRVGTSGSRTALGAGSGAATVGSSSVSSLSTAFSNSGVNFGLTQTVTDLLAGGLQAGSLLTQTYTFTNSTNATQDFQFVRYIDGDLYFNNSSLADGGGRLFNLSGQEILFETDGALGTADTDTFLGIYNAGGTAAGYQIEYYQTLNSLIAGGTALNNTVAGDGADADQFIDVGNAYDVALGLGSNFTLGAGATGTFTAYTIFGTGTPSQIVVPPPVGGVPEPTSWALMIMGAGATGFALRRRRVLAAAA